MPIFKMAWRNIWRNFRRTALSIIVVSFCTGILILFMSIINGLQEQIIKSSVTTFNGYVQIHRKGFHGNESLSGFIEKPHAIVEEISKLENVEAVSSRILTTTLLSYEDNSTGCWLVGIQPQQEQQVTIFYRGIKEGRFITDADQNSILLSSDIARRLSATLNSEVTILTQSDTGSLKAKNLKVLGIIDFGNPELNQSLVIATESVAAELSGYKDKISQIVVRLKSNKKLPETTTQIKNILQNYSSFYGEIASSDTQDFVIDKEFGDEYAVPQEGIEFEKGFEVLSWQDLLKAVVQFIEVEDRIVRIILIIVYIAAILILFNVFIMSIMERKKEFGIMKAIGTKSKQLVSLICLESLAIVCLGILVGIFLGIASSMYLYFYPIDMAVSVDIFNRGMLKPQLQAILSLKSLITPIIGAFITGIIAPLLAAREIAKLSPVETMHSI